MLRGMQVRGSFEVKMSGEPPYAEQDGITFSRARFDKVFSGPLDATSVVQGLMVLTTDPKVRAYVAIERIEGALEGRAGSFVVAHHAVGSAFSLTIMPGSGRGALEGIDGVMRIEITEGQHYYEVEYTLPG